MSRFIESICVKEGTVLHLPEHLLRVKRTFNNFFPGTEPIDLLNVLPAYPNTGKHKLRIVYDAHEFTTQITSYKKPSIKSLQTVTHNTISYAYKSTDRVELERLWDQRGMADDIMIIRNGLVTDSYYANLAFYRKGRWYTPKSPLLKGVKRQVLLQKGRLIPIDIHYSELPNFQAISLINAMLDLEEIVIDRPG